MSPVAPLLLYGALLVAAAVAVGRRAPFAVAAGVLGWAWAWHFLADAWIWMYAGRLLAAPLAASRIGALGLLPVVGVGWAALALRRERGAIAAGERVGPERWCFRVEATELSVTRVATGWPLRLGLFHAIAARLPLGEATLRHDPRSASPGAWRYEGPAHLASIWLAGEVPARLGPLLRRRRARVEDGELRVRVAAWLDAEGLAAVLAEVAAAVEAVRASGRHAVARFQAEARDGADPVRRVDAWRTLADHLPEGLAELAAEGLEDPHPVIRAIAARALGDRVAIAILLDRCDDAEAIRRAAEAVRAGAWDELVDKVAARLDDGAGFELVHVLAQLGDGTHVPRLRELAADRDRPPALRAEARRAIARVHARLGGEAAGRVGLVTGESGQLDLVGEGGEVSIATEEGRG